MSVCNDKVCEATVCGTKPCKNIIPSACGDVGIPNIGDDGCTDVYFTGISDITINQGVGIDLTEGIHAYDGNGDEIEFTVTPNEISKCAVGKHTVTYRAMGEGERLLPTICMGKPGVVLGDSSCNEILVKEKRVVTILQADPPRIDGLSMEVLDINEAFDPSEGVTAIDDNGNTIGFTYSGNVETLVEGGIASFDTEFDQNALSVVADIEPIQDLHGYDKPWSGGAGKNKLDASNIDTTIAGIHVTSDADGNIDISGTRDSSSGWKVVKVYTNIPVGTYWFSSSTPYLTLLQGYTQRPHAITIAEGDTIRLALNSTTAGQTVNVSGAHVQLELGSAETDYEPYSNICPISGHTECVTSVCGKNLLNIADAEIGTAWNGTNNSARARLVIPVKPNTDYVLSMNGTMSVDGVYLVRSTVIPSPTAPSAVSFPRTINSGDNTYLTLGFNKTAISQSDVEALKLQLELGSTATSYEPYEGHTYTTQFGQTVYGGTLDVVSGVLTVGRAMVDMGTLDWRQVQVSSSTGYRFYATLYSVKVPTDTSAMLGLLCSAYEEKLPSQYNRAVQGVTIWTNKTIQIYDPSKSSMTANEFKTAMDGQTLVYPLAEPQTIQLTPQEVALLLGQNNVKASTGEVKVIYQVPMASSGDITYLTEGKKIITYHAEDECGNETSVERDIYVGAYAPITCMANVCKAQVICDNDNQ